MKRLVKFSIIAYFLIGIVISAACVIAGTLEPSAGPVDAGSQMYTLDQIYNRINNGATANKMTTFTEPSSGPTNATMHTLNEIYDLVGLRAPVPRIGQSGYGVAWPNPRFMDNSNGTVTDNLTGLIWTKNANCQGSPVLSNDIPSIINSMGNGSCDLTDGSIAGQWRLPNIREMQSLVHYGYIDPALPNTSGTGKWTAGDPFTNVQSDCYWTSNRFALLLTIAWSVNIGLGDLLLKDPTRELCYVWPVRGGQ